MITRKREDEEVPVVVLTIKQTDILQRILESRGREELSQDAQIFFKSCFLVVSTFSLFSSFNNNSLRSRNRICLIFVDLFAI